MSEKAGEPGTPGHYNADPEIDAGVRADVAKGDAFNIAHGIAPELPRVVDGRFYCPCGASHDRGPLSGGDGSERGSITTWGGK